MSKPYFCRDFYIFRISYIETAMRLKEFENLPRAQQSCAESKNSC